MTIIRICFEWPTKTEKMQRIVIELKMFHGMKKFLTRNISVEKMLLLSGECKILLFFYIVCMMICVNVAIASMPVSPHPTTPTILQLSLPSGVPPYFYHSFNQYDNTNTNTNTPVFNNNVHNINYVVLEAMQNMYIKIKDRFKEYNYKSLKEQLLFFAWDKRYTITAYVIVGIYISIAGFLIKQDYFFFNSHALWGYWKPKSSLAQLYDIPQKQLEQELLISIQKQKFDPKRPTDFVQPIITFIDDINTQIKTIERYIAVVTVLQYLYVVPFFPTNNKKIKRAHDLLTRTQFIRHIFLSWLAEYNIASTLNKQ